MRRLFLIYLCFFLLFDQLKAQKQEPTIPLTLSEAIELARKFATEAINAQHEFTTEYWNYKASEATFLPILTLSSNPNLNRSISKITQPDGSEKFIDQNILSTDVTLTASQNIKFTGGNLFLKSSVQNLYQFKHTNTTFQTVPIQIGYTQDLFGYNDLKWQNKVTPLKYEEAKKRYLETLEFVTLVAISKYFNLAVAQSNLSIAQTNFNVADSLYSLAEDAYLKGKISESKILHLEMERLQAQRNILVYNDEHLNAQEALKEFLKYTDDVNFSTHIDSIIPHYSISSNQALSYARDNSPKMINLSLQKIESESNVALAKSNSGLQANLFLQIGLSQTADRFKAAYRDPIDQQIVSIGITIPILDWNNSKNQIKAAKSKHEQTLNQIGDQTQLFDLHIKSLVRDYNNQWNKVNVQIKTDRVATQRLNAAIEEYKSGALSILELQNAISAKEEARLQYLLSLKRFWTLLYSIRSVTLFDFENQHEIAVNYTELIKD